MRTDMRKVLIERPRAGSSNSYHLVRSRQNRGDWDDMPSKQGMRRPYWATDELKEFTDLLGPLDRYLWSCVGRKWDDVWSDINAQLSNNTVDGHLKHIHVPQFIEINVVEIDGAFYARRRYFGWHEISGLFVHPRTGLVCAIGERYSRKFDKDDKPRIKQDGINYYLGEDRVLRPVRATGYSRKIIGFEREAVYVNGFWYWVSFASVPEPKRQLKSDGTYCLVHALRTDFITGQTVQVGRYRADKKQMSKTDMRRYGLTNE